MGKFLSKEKVDYTVRFAQVITIPLDLFNFFNDKQHEKDVDMPAWCFIEMMLKHAAKSATSPNPTTQIRTSPLTILQCLGVDCSTSVQDEKLDENSVILSRELFGKLMANPTPSTQKATAPEVNPLNGKTFEEVANEDDTRSVVSAQSQDYASSVGAKSTRSTKSKSGSHKTTNDKVSDTLIKVASPYRVKAIALFKELLVNQTNFEAIFSASGIATQNLFVDCIFEVIHDLLDNIAEGNEKNTIQIIQEASSPYSTDVAGAFIRSFSSSLDSLDDQKPAPSALDSVKFYSRFYTALTTGKHFFGAFFDVAIKQPENFNTLGKKCAKKSQRMFETQFETCLSPLCNEAIRILRKTDNAERTNDAARFHLIAQLICQTTLSDKRVETVLSEHPDTTLASFVLSHLSSTSASNTLNKQPSLQEKFDFFSCVTYMLRELPRQVVMSKPNVDCIGIAKRPENASICTTLETTAAQLTNQLKEEEKHQKLPAIVEESSSAETTPIKSTNDFGLTKSMAKGLKLAFVDEEPVASSTQVDSMIAATT